MNKKFIILFVTFLILITLIYWYHISKRPMIAYYHHWNVQIQDEERIKDLMFQVSSDYNRLLNTIPSDHDLRRSKRKLLIRYYLRKENRSRQASSITSNELIDTIYIFYIDNQLVLGVYTKDDLGVKYSFVFYLSSEEEQLIKDCLAILK